jgi:hypothetical protein
MLLYLKDSDDYEVYTVLIYHDGDGFDLRASLHAIGYTKLVLESTMGDLNKLVSSFKDLSEIRSWYFDEYIMARKVTVEEELVEQVREMMSSVADDYDLQLGES